jgi:signal transduction histidine kinase
VTLVNDLLNFARLERAEVPLSLSDIPVGEVVAEVHAIIEPQLRERHLAYNDSACNSRILAHADRERVEQVLVNLLTNAVKFTPAGGSISLSCTGNSDSVFLMVADTGVGSPEEKPSAIFDPFVQLDIRRSGEREGVGLGLAISRGLARMMGGALTVESSMGKGSTFTLVLPRGGLASGSPSP